MSDEKIFFDEQALSVVDSWLGGSTVKANKNALNGSSSTVVAPTSKVGLGFRGKAVDEKTRDALQIRLDKNLKKKKDNSVNDDSNKRKIDAVDDTNNDDDDDDLQLHGIVEDMPISRTQSMSKTVMKSQTHKKTATDSLVSDKSSRALPSSIVLAGPITKDSTKPVSASFQVPLNAADGEEYKRKRTKTRSKQKNIRRDNRPDSQKPAYITNIDAEDYRGRELTEVMQNLLF